MPEKVQAVPFSEVFSAFTAAYQGRYTKPAEALPEHEKYGAGRRFRFGTTRVDVYDNPPNGLTPALWIRGRRNALPIGDLQETSLTEDGGMHIEGADDEVVINPNGSYAHFYTAPLPKVGTTFIPEDAPVIKRDARGTEHVQEMLPDADKVEKQKYLRVELIVGSKSVGVTRRKGAPVQLVAYQKLDPEDVTQEKRWTVKAYNEYVAKVKDLQPGWKIYGIFAHKHWTTPRAGGGFIEDECLNVAGPITIVDKGDNRTPRRGRHAKQESS